MESGQLKTAAATSAPPSAPPTTKSSSRSKNLIDNKYQIVKEIGIGSFGTVYKGVNKEDNHEVAVKIEPLKTEHPQLNFEYKIYRILSGGRGIPRIYYYGSHRNCNALIMELLGNSLEELFHFCSKRFSVKTVSLLAEQMIARLHFVHSKGVIHRDIKPDNFVMGCGKMANCVYLIDFGLGKKYRNTFTGTHIPYCEQKNLTGTVRYASINAHLGIEQSRRDDLESLGYVLMYFMRGSLPWQGLKSTGKIQKYELVSEMKSSTTISDLCDGLPNEFGQYLTYCRGLSFSQSPDYMHFRALFRSVLREMNVHDYEFDWCKIKNEKKSGNHSSNKDKNAVGPYKDKNAVGPYKDKNAVAPYKDKNAVGPYQDKNAVGPSRQIAAEDKKATPAVAEKDQAVLNKLREILEKDEK